MYAANALAMIEACMFVTVARRSIAQAASTALTTCVKIAAKKKLSIANAVVDVNSMYQLSSTVPDVMSSAESSNKNWRAMPSVVSAAVA